MEIDSSLFALKNAPEETFASFGKKSSQLKNAFRRFAAHKASLIGLFTLLFLFLYALITSIASPFAHVNQETFKVDAKPFANAQPKMSCFDGSGFYDGTVEKKIGDALYYVYLGYDTSKAPIRKDYGKVYDEEGIHALHRVIIDTYAVGAKYVTLDEKAYHSLLDYASKTGERVILPRIDYSDYLAEFASSLNDRPNKEEIVSKLRDNYVANPNFNYKAALLQGANSPIFVPLLNASGEIERLSHVGDDQALIENGLYRVRVDYPLYFRYVYGFEPVFLFGSNQDGYDLFFRLAQGLLFSLALGTGVTIINLAIGLIYGAVEGYYGGKVDLLMQRFSEIASGLPSMVLLTLFNMMFAHANNIPPAMGIVLGLLCGFVLTGWIGVSGTTRMQFYRHKNREYVLASRSLGAKDGRIIFKHIFPNAIGTIITNSVLMIPGVIFSESTLSYLGIISFSFSGLNSVGVLLSEGSATLGYAESYLLFFPCLAISLLMVAFHLLGDGLRSAFASSEAIGGGV
ncbi:MAG: ABC transporter permease [Bacilli bacterium]|nr:ABC transporter permease [Bacilli bacterium]